MTYLFQGGQDPPDLMIGVTQDLEVALQGYDEQAQRIVEYLSPSCLRGEVEAELTQCVTGAEDDEGHFGITARGFFGPFPTKKVARAKPCTVLLANLAEGATPWIHDRWSTI